MSQITPITSPSHLTTLLASTTYLIADFYADWCGPCKAISPLFAQLASTNHKPGRILFVKVDVDAQGAVAKKYGIAAMPTFLVFKNGAVQDTIKGADAGKLRAAVGAAAKEAEKGEPRSSKVFQSQGRVLGGPSAAVGGGGAGAGLAGWGDWISGLRVGSGGGMLDVAVRFVGLYLVSLVSLDGYHAAEASPFNVHNRGR